MAIHPSKDVATYIGNNISSLTAGTDVFYGPVRPDDEDSIPDKAVFVRGESGGVPDRSMTQDTELRRPQVIIIVRGRTHDSGYDLSRDIMNTLTGATISGYQDIINLQSEPQTAEQDNSGNHYFSMSFELVVEE